MTRFIASLLGSLGCSECGRRHTVYFALRGRAAVRCPVFSGQNFGCIPVEALDSLVGFPVRPSVRD